MQKNRSERVNIVDEESHVTAKNAAVGLSSSSNSNSMETSVH